MLLLILTAGVLPLAARGVPQTSRQPRPTPEVSAWNTLKKGAADHKASHRAVAIAALSSIGDNSAAVALVERGLSDESPLVRAQSASSLGEMNARSAIPKLEPLLHDHADQVVFAAARALSEMGNPRGNDVLVEVLLRERHAGVPSGMRQLAGPKSLATMAASEGAGIFLGPFAWGLVPIEALASDRSAPARADAAELLAKDPSQRIVRVLEKALRDPNWTVRAAAAEGLGNAAGGAAVPALVPLLKDDKPAVRDLAAAAIIRIGSKGQRSRGRLRTRTISKVGGN